MELPDYQKIIEVLEPFVSEHKQDLIAKALNLRTRHLTLVFEDIIDPHNISAVIRTAECMGVQDIHFIKNEKNFGLSKRITKGSAKWMTIHSYNKKNNIDSCFGNLRKNGYQILGTSLLDQSHSIYDVDISRKTAIVFGTESEGITSETSDKVDSYVHIPMSGFTESFNLSVSAAICLTVLKGKSDWPELSLEEKTELRATWYRKIVREADKILEMKGVVV